MVKRKTNKIFPNEYREKAIANNIALATVYSRLERGWDLDKAVTTPPIRKTYIHQAKREDGWVVSSDRPRLKKSMSVSLYEDLEPLFNKALADSGLSCSEFIANAIEQYLKKLWTPQK
ncbi:hypothetical protein [Geminocystis sp.]|uniref:hypothetical protein n=1 Tax=Geminocystis sp. TaxID=2664100 RepID=UPI0035938912